MIVTRLKLANLRAIEAAEFRFQPGFNLIVGVNGVGKTSVLDALGRLPLGGHEAGEPASHAGRVLHGRRHPQSGPRP